MCSAVKNSSDPFFVVGATAAGKSEVGTALALRINADILSLDSMAIYRGMDIGTAKPNAQQRQCVPHHLIDLVEPYEEFSLAQYLEAAKQSQNAILAKGRQALFVGGTPLYLKSLLRGIFEGPPADLELRRQWTDEAQRRGGDWLHSQLQQIDPVAAARLHPNDTRRLIRAIEVYQKTGRPISELQQQFERGKPASDCRVFVLDWPKEELCARITRRVHAMFAAGLVEEVRALMRLPRPLSKTARQAVGYREVIEYLEGRLSLAETIEQVDHHTRQLAKRQRTWFRSLSECRFVPVSNPFNPVEIADRIAALAAG